AIQPDGFVQAVALGTLELALQMLPECRLLPLDLVRRDDAFRDQPLGIFVRYRLLLPDLLVHERLSEGRLVTFIMPMPPVADHVHHDRLVEALPELDGDARAMHDRLRIVAIHMEDRRLDHAGDIGRGGRGAREARRGGEADLIVDDEMKRAARAVALQPRKPETFGDHALTGEGRIAMKQERQNLRAVLVVTLIQL